MDFLNNIDPVIRTFAMAMLPVVELRGAIPLGIAMGLTHFESLVISFLGSMIPVPFILTLFRPITSWMRSTALFKKLVKRVVDRTMEKEKTIKDFGLLGLLILVAIPLPGTGVWSGSFLSSLLNIRKRRAIPIIAIGNIIAGILVLSITFGISQIF
ncbi:MAG: small multi-drug export protein [Tissierellia bacterium]|nr:small multi-drug export protein [Tissierellia bacterium]